jgi:hypothetical protein
MLEEVAMLKKGMPLTNNVEIQATQALKHAANDFNN